MKPLCDICGTRHDGYQGHVFASNAASNRVSASNHASNTRRSAEVAGAAPVRTGEALLVGIWTSPLIGEVGPHGEGFVICDPDVFCSPDFPLKLGEFLSFDADIHLETGDYWFYASPEADPSSGVWLSNPDLISGDWATRSCDISGSCRFDSTTWRSVSDQGPQFSNTDNSPGGEYPLPLVKIFFQPINEPNTLALMALSLIGLGVGKAHLARLRRMYSRW